MCGVYVNSIGLNILKCFLNPFGRQQEGDRVLQTIIEDIVLHGTKIAQALNEYFQLYVQG